jgi:pyruvate dehydrogenase (quinone)
MYAGSQSIPDIPYARLAELIGLHGIRVDDPDRIGDAWDEALDCDKPVVLEAVVDPEVPPLPPHISFEQAKHFAQAVLSGDPHRKRMVRQSLRQMLDAIAPRR